MGLTKYTKKDAHFSHQIEIIWGTFLLAEKP